MSKQKVNVAWATAAGVAGRISRKSNPGTARSAAPRRGLDFLRAAFEKMKMRFAGWKGQVVSVDEIIRQDGRVPSFHFIGTPYAFFLLPEPKSDHHTQ